MLPHPQGARGIIILSCLSVHSSVCLSVYQYAPNLVDAIQGKTLDGFCSYQVKGYYMKYTWADNILNKFAQGQSSKVKGQRSLNFG